MMNRESISNFYNVSIAVLGGFGFALAFLNLKKAIFSWQFLLLFLFTILIAPRMRIFLPRSKFHLSFSDSMIFLTFLLFGGEAAILIATVEMFAACLHLRYNGTQFTSLAVPFNLGSVALSTSITYCVWTVLNYSTLIGNDFITVTNLLKLLCTLALSQFSATSVFASIYYALKTNTNPLKAWTKECFTSSMTHFLGAALAGIVFKMLNFADIISISISLLVFAVIYYNYRQIMAEMTSSIEQAEQAERDKAEAERDKRIEVERYAEELTVSLKNEEAIGVALRKNQKAFQHAALHDSLTQLPNRAYFGEIIKELIEEHKSEQNGETYILFLDLARFKTINDSLGHSIGDKVLMVVAKRFMRMLRTNDKVARLGGDEFAIILKGLESVEKAEKVAWKIHQKISQPFSLSKNKIYTSVNIGIAPFTSEYETPEDILRDADIAMHYAKEKDLCVAVFTKELREQFVEKAVIEAELRFAIERSQLSIHYQPIVSLKDGVLIGFEALLRWTHPEKGFISPVQFIPIAENSGLIVPITTWILKETCNQLAKWQKVSYAYRDLIVSVNISGKHLAFQSLLIDVEDALEQAKISPASLKLEITESAAMENAEQSIRMLSHLKTLGVQLSIDDFGTGYSSLSYLHQLPFDTLKIDRSFVNSVGENGEDSQILQTIISLAKNLKMRVIAEGIETESQLGILQNLNCEYGQGYLMSKPQPVGVMDDLIRQKHFWLPQPPIANETSLHSDLLNAKSAIIF